MDFDEIAEVAGCLLLLVFLVVVHIWR